MHKSEPNTPSLPAASIEQEHTPVHFDPELPVFYTSTDSGFTAAEHGELDSHCLANGIMSLDLESTAGMTLDRAKKLATRLARISRRQSDDAWSAGILKLGR